MTSDERRSSDDRTFAIGLHRPVYLWGGPGTVRMNRLKFMDAAVDEAVHTEAHTEVGAGRMAGEAAFTWAYLMYNWGFPPETEQDDWAEFRQAVAIYHAAGMRVFGYVQLSNCVYDGSFRDRDWYALDPKGRPFHYYTGRYMTCWTHPGWLEHLRGIVQGIVEASADGVFFDNPWHGCQPLSLAGAWMGPAGCYCARCRAAYRQATGSEMSEQIAPESDEDSRRYIQWRAGQVTATLAVLAGYARSLDPDVVISTNDFDAIMRPSYLVYGIDLGALARVQDVIMIEDYGLPRWEGTGGHGRVLVNNALTLRTARALIGDTPLSTDPYDQGIGFDPVYPGRRFQQGIAEAAACGATMVVKGTEYVHDGVFTLLTAERFASQRKAIGRLHRWLAGQADLYRKRQNVARVGLLYPGDALWQDWYRLAPLYFGAGQALLAAGVPWRAVTLDDTTHPEGTADSSESIATSSAAAAASEALAGLDVLFCLNQLADPTAIPADLRVVTVPDLPGWALPPPAYLARYRSVRSLVSGVIGWLFQAYFRWRWARELVDRSGLVHSFWQTPFFRVPPEPAVETLLEALGPKPYPRINAPAPVLAELWQRGEERQLHLVNYAGQPQTVTVDFGRAVRGTALSPDGPSGGEGGTATGFQGTDLELPLDVYTILQYRADEP